MITNLITKQRAIQTQIETLQKDLEAITRTIEVFRRGNSLSKNESKSVFNVDSPNNTVLSTFKNFLNEYSGKDFSKNDMSALFKHKYPDFANISEKTIDVYLRRLVGSYLEVAQTGKGRRATIYRRLNHLNEVTKS